MPTPDGRAWPTTQTLAQDIFAHIEAAFRNDAWWQALSAGDRNRMLAAIRQGWISTGFGVEFKILRLTERLKDQVRAGNVTKLADVKYAFQAIYSMDVLDQHDEEGNLIP